jgi:hypothetical protein
MTFTAALMMIGQRIKIHTWCSCAFGPWLFPRPKCKHKLRLELQHRPWSVFYSQADNTNAYNAAILQLPTGGGCCGDVADDSQLHAGHWSHGNDAADLHKSKPSRTNTKTQLKRAETSKQY